MKIKRIVGIVVLSVILGLIIYWLLPYSPFRNKFQKDIQNKMDNVQEIHEVVTKADLDKLPRAFQKHLEFVGLEGTKKYGVVNVKFNKAFFLFNTEKNTKLSMDYDLWLFCNDPLRTAYIESNMMGIPFDGVDYMNDDKTGGMKGFVGKAIQIFDMKDKQAYKAGLISWLAEGAVLNPSILVSDFVKLEEIDSNHVKAIVSYNGVTGEGIFSFDDTGRLTEFESEERQVEAVDGVMTAIGWKAIYKNFEEGPYFKIPKLIQSTKVYKDKEVVYFESDDFDIQWYK